MKKRLLIYFLIAGVLTLSHSCDNKEPEEEIPVENYDPDYSDDYSSIANLDQSGLWGPYNLHDPSILKFGEDFYIYSTDVMYGGTPPAGIMQRKSEDLVHWLFRGWAFEGIPSEALDHITRQGQTANTIWAPYAMKVGNEIRLYYSVSVFGRNISAIGMATSESPLGPWIDQGVVISTLSGDLVNAIDPTVVIDAETGQHWLAYGSYWSGINIVELDPVTGMLLHQNDKGKRIAARSSYGASIEGPEIVFNAELEKYFLFVSYGWLEDSYNVRVGRSETPDGPFLDYFGNDLAAAGDNFPMITGQYSFKGHPGWQGFGHCGVLVDGDQYFYASQARLSSNIYLMDLHVRRILWTSNGWPVLAPQRYTLVPQADKTSGDLIGEWEYIYLEKTESRNFSVFIQLLEDGTLSGIENATWSFADDELLLDLEGGAVRINARVSDEWDWEKGKQTICFSGLSNEGRGAWGKKIMN